MLSIQAVNDKKILRKTKRRPRRKTGDTSQFQHTDHLNDEIWIIFNRKNRKQNTQKFSIWNVVVFR